MCSRACQVTYLGTLGKVGTEDSSSKIGFDAGTLRRVLGVVCVTCLEPHSGWWALDGKVLFCLFLNLLLVLI